MDLRGRSSLVEAENKIFEEKILLYRKRVVIDNEQLHSAPKHICQTYIHARGSPSSSRNEDVSISKATG